LLCLSAFFSGLVFYAPIATYYREARGIGIWQISLIESVSLLLSVALEVPWGYVADRIGLKKTLSISFFVLFVSKIVFWKADTFFLFLVERLLLAVANSGMSGADESYLSHVDGSQRGFGIYQACGVAGLVVVSLLFPLFGKPVEQSGFFTVISSLAAFSCIAFLPEENVRTVRRKAMKLPRFNSSLVRFLLAVALLSAVHQMVSVFLVQLCYGRAGLSVSLYSWPYLALSALAVLGGMWSERFFRFFGKFSSFLCFLLSCAGCLMLVSGNLWMDIVGVLLLRLGTTLFMPYASKEKISFSVGYDQATALSVFQMCFSVVEIALTPLFGYLAEQSLPSSLLLGASLIVVAMLVNPRPRR